MLLRKRKVTTEQSDNRRICFLCNSIFINPLSKGAKRKSFQLAEVNIPKHVLKWQHTQDPSWKQCFWEKHAETRGGREARAPGTGSPGAGDNPAPCTAQSHPQPPQQQQGTGVRAAGGSRIVLAVLSTSDGMTGFNNLPLSPANTQVPPQVWRYGIFSKVKVRLSVLLGSSVIFYAFL